MPLGFMREECSSRLMNKRGEGPRTWNAKMKKRSGCSLLIHPGRRVAVAVAWSIPWTRARSSSIVKCNASCLPLFTDSLEPVSACPTKLHVTRRQACMYPSCSCRGEATFPLDVTHRSAFPKRLFPRRGRLRFAMSPVRGLLLQGPDNFIPTPCYL